MTGDLREFLGSDQLMIRQRKEWTEIVVDWETRNKYEVLSIDRRQLGFIVERAGGIWDTIKRLILRSHRSLVVDVFGSAREVVLRMSRPFFWIFSDMVVEGVDGARQGSVHRRFGILHKIYDLRDADGRDFARIQSPIWRLWTFPILGTRAVISKKWGGALREVFTDADTYLIDFGGQDWTLEQRAVIFAAAVSIDFDFFENNTGRGGVLGWLPGGD